MDYIRSLYIIDCRLEKGVKYDPSRYNTMVKRIEDIGPEIKSVKIVPREEKRAKNYEIAAEILLEGKDQLSRLEEISGEISVMRENGVYVKDARYLNMPNMPIPLMSE